MATHARVRQHHLLSRFASPLLAVLPGPSTLRRRLRVACSALAVAVAFSASTLSSPGDGLDLLRAATRAGADRLVELQHEDGTWSRQVGGDGELSITGRPGRALLAAHLVLDEPRYFAAAERSADALMSRLGHEARAASTSNLLFLAELGRDHDRPDCLEAARAAFHADLARRGAPSGAEAAREILARPNPTQWTDGAWRNYLLWNAGELAELARALGDAEWANELTLTLAESWVPKHDHGWYAMGAGRALALLARTPGARARELATVETALLRNNELIRGIPWNETPYDAFAYTMESAAALQGLLIAPDVEARLAGQDGLYWLARQQAPHGGWGASFSVFEGGVRAGSQDWVPAPEHAVDETPELNAEVLLALTTGLRSAPDVLPQG